MNPTADRGNRVLLTLLGLLLLAAGRLGLALSYAAFGAARARQPLLLPAARQFAHRNAGWFWPVVAVVAVVLGLLALRWLVRQVGTDRVRHLELEPNPSSGTTTASSSAISDAVTDEVESYHGADAASVRLIGGERDPDSSWSSPSTTALTPARSAAESKSRRSRTSGRRSQRIACQDPLPASPRGSLPLSSYGPLRSVAAGPATDLKQRR